ncbi:CapA family protein [bacterium]|nr:CapA family protein [bacterium]
MKTNRPLFLLSTGILILSSACKPVADDQTKKESSVKAVEEDLSFYSPKLESKNSLSLVPIKKDGHDFIDIRGVGDSAWANVKNEFPPKKSGFMTALKSFDPKKEILVGDINFINWETTVANRCQKWFDVGYPFLGTKYAVKEAVEWGFNLFSLANNHSEDCQNDGKNKNGALATKAHFDAYKKAYEIEYAGVGIGAELDRVVESTYTVKGKKVKVAFASIAFLTWWTEFTSRHEYHGKNLLRSFKESTADVKILSIHTEGSFLDSKEYARKFIEESSGDIVFQHGPHTWAGVKLYTKPNGDKGVAFHGLGNFIHNGVAHNAENLIGRVLLDKRTLRPAQVQVIPVENWVGGKDVVLKRETSFPRSNFDWNTGKLSSHKAIPVGYFNP